MKNLIKEEPRTIESFEDVNLKFRIWETRIFGDQRDEALHVQSLLGLIQIVARKVAFVDTLRARLNQALTWILGSALGALGLWLFNRLMG